MVGRKKTLNGNLPGSEFNCFQDYIKLVNNKGWLDYKLNSYNEELFYMSIGRHLGLDCRLLDWSASLDTALYFAVSETKYVEEDGHLWIMAYHGNVDEKHARNNPFIINDFAIIKEAYLLPNGKYIKDQPEGILRRFYQNGFFTITPTNLLKTPLNEIELNNVKFFPIVIESKAKKSIIKCVPRSDDYLYLSEHLSIEDDIRAINMKYFI